MNKSQLTEQDIRAKYITPAIEEAGWDLERQFNAGKLCPREQVKRKS